MNGFSGTPSVIFVAKTTSRLLQAHFLNELDSSLRHPWKCETRALRQSIHNKYGTNVCPLDTEIPFHFKSFILLFIEESFRFLQIDLPFSSFVFFSKSLLQCLWVYLTYCRLKNSSLKHFQLNTIWYRLWGPAEIFRNLKLIISLTKWCSKQLPRGVEFTSNVTTGFSCWVHMSIPRFVFAWV